MEKTDMICTCKSDGVAEVEAMRLDVMKRLGLSRTEEMAPAVIMSLAFDYQADAEIYLDQWFGVSLSTPSPSGGLWVACDDPMDGLTYLWLQLEELSPDRRTSRGAGTDADVEAAARWSAEHVAKLEALEAEEKAHEATHGEKYDNKCVACLDNTKHVAVYQTIHRAWGSAALDAAIGQL
jgi:hypothetical protein